MKDKKQSYSVKKGRFNVLDALAIILVVIVICLVISYFDPFEWKNDDNAPKESVGTLTYIVSVTGIDEDETTLNKVNIIKIGDTITNELGTIAGAPEIEHYEVTSVNENNENITVKKFSFKVIVNVIGTYREGIGYYINGKQLRVGDEIALHGSFGEFEGHCVEIEFFKQGGAAQ
jgi:hypothetical protein